LFIGHGSPMNVLGGNPYAEHLARLGRELPRPKAIVAISAHWVTERPMVLEATHPKTIHDFYGFPPELYEITYPAPGAADLVPRITDLLAGFGARPALDWGLDHGTWAVLRHMYPQADIPVLQVSLGAGLSLHEHMAAGAALLPLRREGVLIIGSGNITHNLREIDRAPAARPMAWAVDFDQRVAIALRSGDTESLTDTGRFGPALWRRAHPTLEHFVPLLYALGASGEDPVTFPHEEIQAGSLSMRSVRFG
jgi:4,5-DOPA dioxygenase extradiol